MSRNSGESGGSERGKLMELSKQRDTSEFGSLSKQLAQDEVTRIREEMRKVSVSSVITERQFAQFISKRSSGMETSMQYFSIF